MGLIFEVAEGGFLDIDVKVKTICFYFIYDGIIIRPIFTIV
jgi:hypothetical protein